MTKLLVGATFIITSMSSIAADFSVTRQYVFPIMTVENINEKTKEALIVSTGSAVVISPTRALTVAHVLQSKTSIVYVIKGQPIKVKVIKIDQDKDLALLEGKFGCPCATLGEVGPQQDQSVIIVGYPLYSAYNTQMLTHGHMQGLHQQRLLTTAETTSGGSGGGLFIKTGTEYVLVGIVEGMAGSPIGPAIVQLHQQHNWMSFSIPINTIRTFMLDVSN